ncbi:MAG: hypothetical protein FGM56_09270 [Limnohabitans sp.]|nr:hypothetical protein [Limnohabitans sp.]
MPNREQSNTHSWLMLLVITLGSALSYCVIFQLNFFLFDWLEFSNGVNWVFLPSGLRLLIILVLHTYGAVGIMVGSTYINYTLGTGDDHVFNIITGIISGGAPLIARVISEGLLRLETNLTGLTSNGLLQLSVLFAAISATTHQIWYFWIGRTENFVASTLAMVMGDWVGTVLILSMATLVLRLVRRQ